MTLIIFCGLSLAYPRVMEEQLDGPIFKTAMQLDGEHASEKEVTAREVINDDRRRVLEISIRAGGALNRHLTG